MYGLSRAAPGGRTCSTRERAVVRFATLLTSHLALSSSATWTSLARSLSTVKVFELVVAIATANWTNRFNDGLGTPARPTQAAGDDPRIPALSSR